MSYGWHQWQLPQSQKRLLAHSLVVVLTSITAKGAGQFSHCALENSCQLQREGSRYPQGRTKHQRQTPGLSQPPFGLDCTTQDFQMYISSMGEHFVNLGSLLLRLACRNPASSKTAFFPIKLESGWSWKREDRQNKRNSPWLLSWGPGATFIPLSNPPQQWKCEKASKQGAMTGAFLGCNLCVYRKSFKGIPLLTL